MGDISLSWFSMWMTFYWLEKGLLGLSQRSYIEKVLKRFNMQDCAGSDVPIAKGDKLSTK